MNDPEPFLARLREAKELGCESDHRAADQVLVDALRTLGATEIADAYDALRGDEREWWYA